MEHSFVSLFSGPAHLFIIIGVLSLAIILFGAGKSLGKLALPLCRKILHMDREVTVNVGEMISHGAVCLVDPLKCPDHKAEQERSMRNQENIGKLFERIDHVKECIENGHNQVSKEIGQMKTEIIKALAIIIREGRKD